LIKILVSGKSKGAGKTTLVEKIIKNLRGNVYVIKSSIHEKYKEFELIDDKDTILEENTDTYLFSKAGANKVFFLKSNKKVLQEGINQKINKIMGYDYLIIEGNSIIDYLNFNLVFYLDREGGDTKESAEKCKTKADLIINYEDNSKIKFNNDRISCLQAHLIGHSLDIPLFQLGKMMTQENIKIKNCQLGLF